MFAAAGVGWLAGQSPAWHPCTSVNQITFFVGPGVGAVGTGGAVGTVGTPVGAAILMLGAANASPTTTAKQKIKKYTGCFIFPPFKRKNEI